MFKRMAVTVVVALGLAAPVRAQMPDPSASGLPSGTLPAPMPAQAGGPGPFLPGPAPAEERWFVSADYLSGFIRSVGLPPLLTSSPQGTSMATAGVLGQNSPVTFGGDNVGGNYRAGFQLGAGGWLDADRTFGVEAGFFMLDNQNSSTFINSPTANPIIARPFVDVTTGLQASQLIAFPGLATGSAAASAETGYFYSANVDFKEIFYTNGGFHLESLLGYRFLRFDDRLGVDTNETAVGSGLVAAGTNILTSDRFTALNTFHAADFGLRAVYEGDNWSVTLLSKLAVGNIHRSVGIAGTTTVGVPGGGAPIESNGGLLALSSNIGVYDSNDWVIAPEGSINFAWDITRNVRVNLGYTFLYWTDVARAATQANLNVNPNLLPPAVSGPTALNPAFTLQKSDLWVQTINLGLEFRF